MEKQYSISIGEKVEGETPMRRSLISPNKLVDSPSENVKTLYDMMQYSVKTHGNKAAMGYRKVESIVEEEKEVTKFVGGEEIKEKKIWKYFQMSPYTYLTYEDVNEEIKNIGSGLTKIGLQPNDKMTIYAATTVNWMLVAHGCFRQGATIVTAYETLGEDGLLHSMNESEVKGIFTNADLLSMTAKVAGKVPTLQYIIYDGDSKGEADKLKNDHQGIKILTLDELKQLGKEHLVEPNPPKSEDLCCIMYTSGSTGNPKGVLLTHGNLVAAIAGTNELLIKHIRPDDTLIAYLPLAHVLEFAVEHVCIWWGVTLGYGNVRTLTDASVRNCFGDIREFKPSLMAGVPAVWESIRKGVLSKVNSGGPTMQKVFNAAFKAKSWLMSKELPTKPLDIMVFNKIRQQTGGRLRLALSGGAPISKETQEFLSISLCPILQGYGMTESCGFGSVGAPIPCLEIKLVDVAEAGYLSTNTRPQGEVWIRGPCVTKGYHKNEKVTKETITEDGWLQTGDIGEWKENGTLCIIDRKKNLVKLSNGEYIALEKLESVYKSTLFISNICVCANSFLNKPVALIHPVEAQLRNVAKEKNLGNMDFEQLCSNKEITTTVFQACLTQAKKAGLKPAEMLGDITLVPDEWTPQNGLMTAASKIKRKDIQDKYKTDLDRMYKTTGA
ncbi:9547_t:CDS:2 [Scutellospora calospora]|uniref:9547_t:CDS:1 n=1 Tax=Scutellospora calospora TaxID=85575 RepID=A0ACA9KPQ3_9GLOM|nr:9547_t:CDS:2 [Scutellospora calospora]